MNPNPAHPTKAPQEPQATISKIVSVKGDSRFQFHKRKLLLRGHHETRSVAADARQQFKSPVLQDSIAET